MNAHERGAAAVEFALVATLLLTLVVGVFEGGRLWMIQSSLSQAAREGAREMAIKNDIALAEDVIVARAGAIGVSIAPEVSPGACAPEKTVVARASATVTSATGLLDPLFGADHEVTLTGEAQMRCGG